MLFPILKEHRRLKAHTSLIIDKVVVFCTMSQQSRKTCTIDLSFLKKGLHYGNGNVCSLPKCSRCSMMNNSMHILAITEMYLDDN